jgi:hypothetical protein
MDAQFIDMAKGFGSSAPIIVLLWYLLREEKRASSMKDVVIEKRTDQLLEMIPQMIEAENDMTNALNLLSGKIK